LKPLKKTLYLGALSLTVLAGCATSERASLNDKDNLTGSLDELATMEKELRRDQIDLLGHEHFEEGADDLADAREAFQEKEENSEVIEELEEAKGHFLMAQERAKAKKAIPHEILKTRSQAIANLPRFEDDLTSELEKIDDDLLRRSDDFEETLNAKEVSSFQKRYHNLEVMVVQNEYLHSLRKVVENAKREDASDLAPETLRKAQIDLATAENAIKQTPRQRDEFKAEVLKANKSIKLLSDVMTKLTGEAKGASEDIALKLVYQERKVGKLSDTLGHLQGDLVRTQSQALSAAVQVRFQEAMDRARKEFSEEEAEVYQQGDRLILRLKNLNFKTGSAKIPESSTDLLTKIDGILKAINPQSVSIVGHTDSRGSQEMNQKLSFYRAKAVESFLSEKNAQLKTETKGLGEERPLATNETLKGRALNRRVDIIVNAK